MGPHDLVYVSFDSARVTRVLLVHQPTDGGVGRHVRDLANGLSRRGCEVVLCGPKTPRGPIEYAGHHHLDLQRAIAPRADLAAISDFAQIVRELHPDVIHAHSSKAGAVTRVARLANPRVPVLYSPHGYAFAGYFERSGERRAYRTVERILAPAASRIVCVCEAEARIARSLGPANRVRVVHNGIQPADDGQLDTKIAELAIRGPVVGALTLLRPGKGLETLIDATPLVLARHPNTQVAIIGDGPELDALRTRAQQRDVAHAVSFLGPSKSPLSVLRGIEVFVHPSWAEAFPYVILEAMSLGLPIVASDVGGVGEAIVDRESGLLVPPHDERALAQALVCLLDDPDSRARMGALALRRASMRFTLAAMIERLIDVYDEVA
jgi:glycosyltransferase involved in cell wall biosynthesis